MPLWNEYTFTILRPGENTQVYPVNDGLKFVWDAPENGTILRRKLTTTLLFRGTDFSFFYNLYQLADCEETKLKIQKRCNGELADDFTGVLALNEGEYDIDRCEVQYQIKPDDKQTCFDQNAGTKINWLALGTGATLKTLYGTIEETTCNYTGGVIASPAILAAYKTCWSGVANDAQDNANPDPATGWRPIENHQTYNPVGPVQTIQTKWARERATGATMPPGDGWVNIGGTDWARPVVFSSFTQTTGADGTTIDFLAQIADIEADNARLMRTTLEDAISNMGCSLNVISNYLNINPDGTNPDNEAYDWAELRFADLLIFQKSDVVRENDSNNATILDMSVLEFLNDLKQCLNLEYGIDGDTLRIEHVSYFAGVTGPDLTGLGDGKYIRGTNKFKTTSGVPSFESFEYQESYNDEFRYNQIAYPSQCATEGPISRRCNLISADFGGLLNNDAAGLVGVVLVAAYDLGGNEYLLSTYDDVSNGALAWAALFEEIWAFERFLYTASPVPTVRTVVKRKEQTPITIPFCCYDSFDPKLLYISGLGAGKVKSAEHDTRTATLTINLMQE